MSAVLVPYRDQGIMEREVEPKHLLSQIQTSPSVVLKEGVQTGPEAHGKVEEWRIQKLLSQSSAGTQKEEAQKTPGTHQVLRGESQKQPGRWRNFFF